MPIHHNVLKQRYQNLTVKELEKKYKEIESYYCFDTKENQIQYIIDNFLIHPVIVIRPAMSERIALEELLKEKTGKEYSLKEQLFNLTLNDYIDYLAKNETLFNKSLLDDFFSKFNNLNEEDKIKFIILLVLSNSFNKFMQELTTTKDIDLLFSQYMQICQDFYYLNAKEC